MFKYQDKRQGDGVVKDFQRLMQTGDVAKITPRLYHALTMHGGFIAHYDIHGFRATYAGRLTELLRGEFQPLTDPDRFNWPALEDSGYADGMSAGDVMRDICRVGAAAAEQVRERERQANRLAEIAHLCRRYGITAFEAAALVDRNRAEVTA